MADPSSWSKGSESTGDSVYMRDVIRKHCKKNIKNYTFTNGFKHKFWIPRVLGVRTVTPLNLCKHSKRQMVKTLSEEYGYKEYGQKHFEDLLTKFLEGVWLPKRFGHDMRRPQLSSLVITGQMKRDDALKILENPPIKEEECQELFAEVARKLNISKEELLGYFEMEECTEKFRNISKIYELGIRVYELIGLEKRIRR